MDAKRLDEIGARAAKATAGPWEAIQADDPRGQPQIFYRALVATVEKSPERHLSVVAKVREVVTREEWPHNNAFIAASRADVPDLVAEVRRLRAWIQFWLDDSRDECILASVPVDQLRDVLAGEKVKP